MFSTTLIISGTALRHNIHSQDKSDLQPTLLLNNENEHQTSTGFTAVIDGYCEVIYDPFASHDIYIATNANVELKAESLKEPSKYFWCISTNLPSHRSNKKFLRENPHIKSLDKLQAVIALRHGKTGKAQYGFRLSVPYRSEIYYAAQQLNNIKPLPCGARTWLHCYQEPYFDKPTHANQLALF